MVNQTYCEDNLYRGIPLVTKKSKQYLNPLQFETYQEHRRSLAEWMLNLGKNPSKAEGYSKVVVENRMNRLDLLYRFVWNQQQGFTQDITPNHADEWMKELAKKELSESTKCDYQKSVKTLFKWKRHSQGKDIEWEPNIDFSDPSTSYTPRDYLTREERKQLREAVMTYETIPHYNSMSAEERERYRSKLAQRLQKPKEKVTKQDFIQANSFKYPSMIYIALDAGMRPCEIGAANVEWIDLTNGVLRIPREESSKNEDNWNMSLKSETVSVVERWLEERDGLEKYDGREAVWLTKYGNRYDKDSFRGVFRRVAQHAGFDLENRDLTPYSIRHSTGTYMAEDGSLAVAAQQLRHKSKQTTQKYEHSSMDRQQEAVDQIE